MQNTTILPRRGKTRRVNGNIGLSTGDGGFQLRFEIVTLLSIRSNRLTHYGHKLCIVA
jgi:hypothetical protein